MRLFASEKYSSYPFFIAGSLKLTYDFLLLLNFHDFNRASNTSRIKEEKPRGEDIVSSSSRADDDGADEEENLLLNETTPLRKLSDKEI